MVQNTKPGESDESIAAIQTMIAAARVDDADLKLLHQLADAGTGLSEAQAEALFALDAAAQSKAPEWTAFFVAAITDYVVWQSRPSGVVNSAQAEWLLRCADKARTLSAFALLVNVLSEAHRAPAWLAPTVRGRAAEWPGLDEALKAPAAA